MEGSWCTGPPEDRRRYRVPSPEPLAGGQSYVFDARAASGRRVALKQVGDVSDAAEQRLRERWTRVTASPHPRLAHPIELFRGPGLFTGDVPPDDDCDLLYAASDWTDGQSLRAAAPAPRRRVATMAADLGAALAHLHEGCGLLHRDVHPGNVVVDDDGRATLIDLGAVRPDDGSTTTTVAGLLGFIAPELLHGPADRRSDRWSLAMTLVFAVLGHPAGRQREAEVRRELRRRLASARDPDRAVRLLLQGIAEDPDARPTDPAAWGADLAAAIAGPRPAPPAAGRVRRALGAAVAVVLAAGVVAAVVGDDPGSEAAGPTTTRSCSGFDPAVDALLAGGCVIGPPEMFKEASVYPVDGGVIIQSPASISRLTTAEYVSYREIAGRSQPENAAVFGGYPLEATSVDGTIQIPLSGSGILIGPRADSQLFWLPASVLGVWLDHGGVGGELGLPMTNPYFATDGVRQDFAGGFIELADGGVPLPDVDPAQLEIHIDADPGAPLQGLDLTGRILRQPTGTAWYVDGEGRRRWIPDGGVYHCIGGDAAMVADGVPGSAIATVPLGPPVACG